MKLAAACIYPIFCLLGMTLDLIDVNEENNQVQTIGYKSETGRIRF